MSKRLAILTGTVLALAVGCGAPVSAPPPAPVANPAEGMEMWAQNHPDASRELGEWVRRHPEAAHLLFDWDGHHHDQARHFVIWTIGHPNQGIDDFSMEHSDRWDEFDAIMQTHRPAAMEFMSWCRARHGAAESLMNHPRGLEWAGHHLYPDAWMMNHG